MRGLSRRFAVVLATVSVATAAWAERAIMPEAGVVKVGADVPLDVACVIGCAVQTGVGAVLNTAKVEEGATVLVLGAGGIGIAVTQGARLAAASRIIVVDPVGARRDAALTFGATDVIDPTTDDVFAQAFALTNGIGVDYAFECVGHPALIRQCIDLLDWGGSCVLLGVPKFGSEASFVVQSLYNDKSILGCRYGAARPHHDIPLFVDLYKAGKLKLDELVTRTYTLEEINQGYADMNSGANIRGMVLFDDTDY